MKLLVCGGREFNDFEKFKNAMRQLPFIPTMIINGDARGADSLATTWAKMNGIHYAIVPALWDNYHNSAGPLRNSAMLILKPDYCVALPGGTGTADMVKKCKVENIPVWEPYT